MPSYYELIKQSKLAGGSGGGPQPVLVPKLATENGIYYPVDDDADGYSEVTVNVPQPQPVLVPKLATENGIYYPVDDEADGYSSVTVNVPEKVLTTKTITASGTYNAEDDSADGYSSVTVNIRSYSEVLDQGLQATLQEEE